jgi:hypothetical protein
MSEPKSVDDPLAASLERLEASTKGLEASAARLNAASDEIAQPISSVEATIKGLNLGLAAWTKIDGGLDGDTGQYWRLEIGYAKCSGKWGIVLRTVDGDVGSPEDDVELWLFNDAPRTLRLQAIEKLPELLVELLAELTRVSDATAEKIKSNLGAAQRAAQAVANTATTRQRRHK